MIYENLFVFTVVAFYIWSLRSIFYWVKLWQNVGYQPKVFIRSQQARQRIRQYLFSFSSILSWLGIAGALYLTINDKPAIYYQLAIFAIFLIKTIIVIRDIITSRILYPTLAFRSVLLMILSTMTLSILFMFPLVENFLWLLVLDRLLFFVVNGFVFLFSFPSEIADDLQVKKAILKVHEQKSLSFVLLTGSEEAGEMSHFLTQVLQKHMHVVTIHADSLTQSHLASALLKKLSAQTDVVIVTTEKPQDLSWMKFFFSPQIMIIFDQENSTYNKKQYLALLLSLSTKKSKVFLSTSLEPFLHGKRSKQFVSFFTSSGKTTTDRMIRVGDVVQKKLQLEFRVFLHSTILDLRTPLIGAHLSTSLLLTAAILHVLGFTQKQIKNDFSSLLPFPRKLVYHHSPQGVVFVDNTANTSVEDTKSLLNYAQLFSKSRFFIVGKESVLAPEKIMKQLATNIATKATHVLLLPSPYRSRLKKIIKQKNNDCLVREFSPQQVGQYVLQHAGRGDVVMFEGEDSDEVSRFLYNSYASNA